MYAKFVTSIVQHRAAFAQGERCYYLHRLVNLPVTFPGLGYCSRLCIHFLEISYPELRKKSTGFPGNALFSGRIPAEKPAEKIEANNSQNIPTLIISFLFPLWYS